MAAEDSEQAGGHALCLDPARHRPGDLDQTLAACVDREAVARLTHQSGMISAPLGKASKTAGSTLKLVPSSSGVFAAIHAVIEIDW